MGTKDKYEIELLNSEGPILVASLKMIREKCFLVTDKKSGESQHVWEESFRQFLNGEKPIIFSCNTYNYAEYPDSMKPSNRDLHDFVDAFIISLTII